MHILIIPSWYKSIDKPLLGSFFEEQARALMKCGHTVGILFPGFYPFKVREKHHQKFEYFVNDNGLNTISFNVRSIVPRFHKLNLQYFYYRAYKGYKDYVSRFGKPDVIHAHSVFDVGLLAAYISKKTHIPFVVTEHLTHYITGAISSKRELELTRINLKQASKAMTVSTSFRHDLAEHIGIDENKLIVMHNMVADLFFEDVFEKKFTEGEEFIFLTNSFLERRKNHKLLFWAFKILIEKNYPVRLIVGGDGQIRKELEDYCVELGIENNVEFVGALTRKQVKQQLDNCHAFVLASMYETFGVVLIEALACGRPVISTDSKGPRDIVNEFNGYLVENNNENDLAAAMEKVVNEYESFNPDKIIEDCRNRFSEKHIAEELTKVYNEVVKKN